MTEQVTARVEPALFTAIVEEAERLRVETRQNVTVGDVVRVKLRAAFGLPDPDELEE